MYSMTMLLQPVSSLITIGGAEVALTRRYVDLCDVEAMRLQYNCSDSIDVRVEYSIDYGGSWNTLIPEYGMIGGNPKSSCWQTIPEDCHIPDVILRVYATGSGILTTINFVEIQFK